MRKLNVGNNIHWFDKNCTRSINRVEPALVPGNKVLRNLLSGTATVFTDEISLSFEILDNREQGSVRVVINGKIEDLHFDNPQNNTSLFVFNKTFNSFSDYKIELLTKDCALLNFEIANNGKVWKSDERFYKKHIMLIGDSYISSTNNVTNNIAVRIMANLDNYQFTTAGVSSTGQVKTMFGRHNFTQTLVHNHFNMIDTIIVWNGINDRDIDINQYRSGVRNFLNEARKFNKTVIMISPFSIPNINLSNHAEVVRQETLRFENCFFIDTETYGWGSSLISDNMMAEGNFHLNTLGEAYIAARVSNSIRRYL